MDTTQKDKWRDLDDEGLKLAIRSIINTSSSKDEVNKKAKEEIGYPYQITVNWHSSGRMFQAMFFSKEGTILSL